MEFKTIRVSVEGLIVGERSVNKENDFLTNLIFDRDTVDKGFKLNNVFIVIASINSKLGVSVSSFNTNYSKKFTLEDILISGFRISNRSINEFSGRSEDIGT